MVFLFKSKSQKAQELHDLSFDKQKCKSSTTIYKVHSEVGLELPDSDRNTGGIAEKNRNGSKSEPSQQKDT